MRPFHQIGLHWDEDEDVCDVEDEVVDVVGDVVGEDVVWRVDVGDTDCEGGGDMVTPMLTSNCPLMYTEA